MSAQPGRVLNGRYRLIRTVGVGSQASVWIGEHLALTTQVAVKLIDPDLAKRPDARERFKREATAAAQIRSPHVVQILDHGIDGDQPFIVMELLEGEDLFQRLEKRHHLSIKDTSKIVTQIARALTRAHAAGVVHRDLKPENIFLTHNDDDEIVKVLDFGVAKVRDAAKVTMQKTGVGTLIGTPHYMSPEQVKGIGEVDFRTDLWALGVLGYQCVTGELPFDSEGVGDLLIKITIGDMPVPSKVLMGVPPAFDAWFARICDRDPARRFANARAAAEALARIAGLSAGAGGPTSVPRPGASVPPPAAAPAPAPAKPLKPGAPPPRPSSASAAPARAVVPPPVAAKAPPPPAEDELDDDDWEEAEPAVSLVPPPPVGSEDETMPLPALAKDLLRPSALPAIAAPAVERAPPAAAQPAPPSPEPAPVPVAPPPAVAPAPASGGPVNPFLVNDFVAPPAPPSSSGIAPAARPSGGGFVPAAQPLQPRPAVHDFTPAPSIPRSTVSGVVSPDIDIDDEELAFGKNRRKKMVRWLTIGLVLLAVGLTWMVVSSQLRALDPVPDVATAPPATSTPPAVTAIDPVPATTSATTSSSSSPATRPTAKPKLTGTMPVRAPKKPNDGSVELPTPGDDPDLPPPAP